jgi:hypothetical protein|tara:strand:+ start:207 stop:365 length:159 start_codon:yes stop_codon:yes gene_type:complete
MSKYTFYVEGCGIELSVTADSEKSAHKMAWAMLSDEQKNSAACLDCVEVEAV